MFRKLTGSSSLSTPAAFPKSSQWKPELADPIGLKQGLIILGPKMKEPFWVVMGADSLECYPKRMNRETACGEPTRRVVLSDISSVLEPSDQKHGNCLKIEVGESGKNGFMLANMSQGESELWGSAIRSGMFLCTSAMSTEQQAQTGHWLPGSIKHVLVSFHVIQQNEWKHMKEELQYTNLIRLGNAALQVAVYTRLLGLKLTNVTSWRHLDEKMQEFFNLMQSYSCTYKESRMMVSINSLLTLLTKIKSDISSELADPSFVRSYSNTAPPSLLRRSNESYSPRQAPKVLHHIRLALSKSHSQSQFIKDKIINRPTHSASLDGSGSRNRFMAKSPQKTGSPQKGRPSKSWVSASVPQIPHNRARLTTSSPAALVMGELPTSHNNAPETDHLTNHNTSHNENSRSTMNILHSPPSDRNNAVEDVLASCKEILVCCNHMTEHIDKEENRCTDEASVHIAAKEGAKCLIDMMKQMDRIREQMGVVSQNLESLAEDVRAGFQELISSVRDVIANRDSHQVIRTFQISTVDIPEAIRSLLRACQTVAEVRVAEKRLVYTKGEVDLNMSALLSTLDEYQGVLPPDGDGLTEEGVRNSIKVLQMNGESLEALPALLKKADSPGLFEGLKQIADRTHQLSTVLSHLYRQMDLFATSDSREISGEFNRPRKNSLVQDKTSELKTCSHLVHTTSVQLMVDSKMYISTNFSRPNVMLSVLRNATVLMSLGSTMINTLRFYIDVEIQNHSVYDSDEEYEEEEEFWEEENDDVTNVVYEVDEEGAEVVKAATLNKLIENLTASQLNDHKFQKIFLATYRSFTTPAELLTKLIQRYNVVIPRLPRDINMKEYAETTLIPIQLRVINTIKLWIESSPFDFDRTLREKLAQFMEKINADGHSISAKQITSLASRPVKAARLTNMVHDVIKLDETPLDFTKILDQFSEEAVALSLTVIDSTFFVNIKPHELMEWSKSPGKMTSSLGQLSTRFNQVSYWAVSCILECSKLSERTKQMEKLLDLATRLRKLNNFCSLFAIVSALNTVPIYRLTYTKEGLSQRSTKLMENFIELMNPRLYLECLRSINPPCVPYVGVWLTQLIHVDEGNSNKTPEGLINFRKSEMFANIILDVQLYQQMQYRDAPADQQLVSIFMQLPRDYNEEYFWTLSHLREPRNAERSDIV